MGIDFWFRFPTCADSVLDGRALVERDLVVAADGADGAAVSGAEDGAVGRRRALAADRVVSRGTGTSSPVAVRAQIARLAAHHRLLFGRLLLLLWWL